MQFCLFYSLLLILYRSLLFSALTANLESQHNGLKNKRMSFGLIFRNLKTDESYTSTDEESDSNVVYVKVCFFYKKSLIYTGYIRTAMRNNMKCVVVHDYQHFVDVETQTFKLPINHKIEYAEVSDNGFLDRNIIFFIIAETIGKYSAAQDYY